MATEGNSPPLRDTAAGLFSKQAKCVSLFVDPQTSNMKGCLALFVFWCTTIAVGADDRSGQNQNDSSLAPRETKIEGDTAAVKLREMAALENALDASRDQIMPSLGATKYTVNRDQIDSQSQGANAPFDQTMLRFPGVAQDELDKRLHVRGEEAHLQYRINGVLLPDGLSGFGQELSPRFVDKLSLLTGTLPAQYGGRTAGIVDIQTKSGASLNGGDASFYGGSYDTVSPTYEYGGVDGKVSYYFTANYLHDGIGMANPTSSSTPLHDDTDQFKGFAYLSYLIDDTSRLSLILSGAHSDFQLPNTPGQDAQYQCGTQTAFDSATLNENQSEQSYYEVLAYQKKTGDLDFQLAQSMRYSDVSFAPDAIGDLMFNGIAAREDHRLVSNGLQGDASYVLDEHHTLRGGFTFTVEEATVNTSNLVFPAAWNGSSWVQTGTTPYNINDDYSKQAYLYGFYLQDEWKIFDNLTLNYGGRFDVLNAYLNENQISPRINAVYQATETTVVHGGYGQYFTPPPLEFVNAGSVAKFANTTHGADPDNMVSSPVKSERYHYFDVGMTQKVLPELRAGLDAYYKIKKNVLDEGQFGPAMIFSPNNADQGKVYGVEATLNYEKNGFSVYGNFAWSRALAQGLNSGQFQFDPDELAYLQSHWYHLDHDQDFTASAGVSYKWGATKVYADAIYGSGLYSGFGNQQELPGYVTVNTGIVHVLKLTKRDQIKVRFDIVNLLDTVYEIRDGTGIGVFAPQYLPRRGLYGSLEYAF